MRLITPAQRKELAALAADCECPAEIAAAIVIVEGDAPTANELRQNAYQNVCDATSEWREWHEWGDWGPE